MDLPARRQAASALADAERSRLPIEPLSKCYPGMDLDDAYAIQMLNIEDRLTAGSAVRGHKVGLTSKAMQTMLGVDQPDYGHLLTDMFIADRDVVAADRYLQPRVEIEIAFVLGSGLGGGGVTAADVLRATEFVVPAIEVIDSRIADWAITLEDTVADNGSSAGVVLGCRPTKIGDRDLRLVRGILERSGRLVETGLGAAVLGNPVSAVAWLANSLHQMGVALEAGHVVLPGSCTRAVDVVPGDVVRAEFDGLGDVVVCFE
ncbi:MAG TPA: 2-keto-4-pentenoate hydratase [Acidimicrobiales bacterium]|nr:2-keto-4-pentenoate hydratase [Acidimicrobiales bacterium]